MNNTKNDGGGPFSVDINNLNFNVDVCEKLTLSMAELPSFLTQIMPELLHLSGGWERTVTFTAGEQESRALVACCIDSSCAPNKEKKFTIGIKTRWITGEEISKEQRLQTTKNSTILGLLLKEINQGEYIQSRKSAFFAATISLQIQTIEEGRQPATSDALLGWPCALECQNNSLRDYFAGQALTGLCANSELFNNFAKMRPEMLKVLNAEKCDSFEHKVISMTAKSIADAMIAARNS